jgi:hypothetical protein
LLFKILYNAGNCTPGKEEGVLTLSGGSTALLQTEESGGKEREEDSLPLP